MLSELGGMDDGHPVLGGLNFGNLSPEERERVNKYYRVSDEDVNDDSFSEIDSELEDDFEEDEYSEPKRIFNRNSERPSRPRPFNRNSERPSRPRPFNRD